MFLHVRKVKGSETSEDKALKFCMDSVLVLISILSDGIFGNASRFDFMIFEYLNHVIFTCKTVKKKIHSNYLNPATIYTFFLF